MYNLSCLLKQHDSNAVSLKTAYRKTFTKTSFMKRKHQVLLLSYHQYVYNLYKYTTCHSNFLEYAVNMTKKACIRGSLDLRKKPKEEIRLFKQGICLQKKCDRINFSCTLLW